MTHPLSDSPDFLFTGCQVGAEAALKVELARHWPAFRFAFSRPGFLTFKLPIGFPADADFDLRSTLARCSGRSYGKVESTSLTERVDALRDFKDHHATRYIHVWHRQMTPTPERGRGSERLTQAVTEAVSAIHEVDDTCIVNEIAHPGALVADCILVEPDQWWFGLHWANSVCARWPGGNYPVEMPERAVSRAYIKLAEALAWSRMPLHRNDVCVELGSAPGGSSQFLLERGLRVIGIDPADMHADVLAHSNFQHRRCRGRDLKRREFQGIRWLFADSNVAPQHTLDTVEDIVTHSLVNVHGMLLTLKLLDWNLASDLPAHMARIRGWGYAYVKARQLSQGGQEVCVFALRRRSTLRRPNKSKPAQQRPGPRASVDQQP